MNDSIIPKIGKAIAVVSGKGGSGKTMITAVLAQILDSSGKKVLVVDSDLATAGLTYYMGLKTVKNISTGLTNLVAEHEELNSTTISRITQKMEGFENSYFIGVGDHRRFYKKYDMIDFETILLGFLKEVISEYDFIIFDCRGGIDKESLLTCSVVDEILLVVETDTTSFQATQHLVDVLYDNDLSDKLSGFLVNKVFDDPRAIAMNGTAAFRSQYLGSIPFDLDATRSFLIGEIPRKHSSFSSQTAFAIEKLIPGCEVDSRLRKMEFLDFRGLNIRDRDSLLGGLMLSFATLSVGIPLLAIFYKGTELSTLDTKNLALILILMLIGFSSGIEPIRKSFGRVLSVYMKIFSKILFK